MIKFFRKIRYDLMEKNKTGKYFKYAIGEIILVVIGILIALSINNWNEDRKQGSLELEILKAINLDLAENVIRIQRMITRDSLRIIEYESIIKILKDSTTIYHDSMDTKFGQITGFSIFFPRKLGYESLKSRGLEIVKNDSLRSKIVYLYDDTYSFNDFYNQQKSRFGEKSKEIVIKYFETDNSLGKNRPNDFIALKENKEFMNFLTLKIGLHRFYLDSRTKAWFLPQTLNLIRDIEEEIERLENK